MVTKKDTETPSSVQLSFLVHKPSGKAPFFFFFPIYPKFQGTNRHRASPLLSPIEACVGSIPCVECQNHLWHGARKWAVAQKMWIGIATSFSLSFCFILGSNSLLAQSRISEQQPGTPLKQEVFISDSVSFLHMCVLDKNKIWDRSTY